MVLLAVRDRNKPCQKRNPRWLRDDLPEQTPRDVDAAQAAEHAAANSGMDMDSVDETLAADLATLQAELAEAQDRALRSAAELENFRRRTYRQFEEERRYANLDLLRELLPIWDNMGRAVEAAEKSGQVDALLEGFKMVSTQLENVFERFHCTRIEAEGRPFDPNLHEAISQLPSDDHPNETVLHVTQVGFLLHDRVVRPSQVVVSKAPATPAPVEEVPAEDASDDGPAADE